jgi:cell pole-organizing protein PopZ
MATTAKSMPGEIYMDDFLHNLRNPNKKRFDRNKPYDSQYRSNDRFSGNRKTPPQQRKPSDSDQMPAIKRLMENILDQQKRLAEFNERMARATERQADALESIAGRFKPQPAEADLPVALATSVESPSEPTLTSFPTAIWKWTRRPPNLPPRRQRRLWQPTRRMAAKRPKPSSGSNGPWATVLSKLPRR